MNPSTGASALAAAVSHMAAATAADSRSAPPNPRWGASSIRSTKSVVVSPARKASDRSTSVR